MPLERSSPIGSKSAVYKQQHPGSDLVTSQAAQEKDEKQYRKPLSVITTQIPNEVAKAKEHHVIGIKKQSPVFSHVASQVTHAKSGQALSMARHSRCVALSETPNTATKTEEHSVQLIKQPVPKLFYLGMFEISRPLGKGKFG
ncbi:hypothetical protein BDW62DRAFT_187832 [Aspergillus aurantiobrunneus]